MTPEQFAEESTKILVNLPKEFRGAISSYAWEKGHAYGYEEVLSYTKALVECLESPVYDFEQRISEENRS